MKQVNPGPEHSTQVETTEIDGALVMSVPTAKYEYGSLSEIFNSVWESIYTEPLEHMYVIHNDKNQREEWHMHRKTTDRYVLLSGELEIALYDDRAESSTHQKIIRLRLNQVGRDGPHALRIPPGVWHTFRSVSDGFLLLNNKFPQFNRADPDKYFVSFSDSHVAFKWE